MTTKLAIVLVGVLGCGAHATAPSPDAEVVLDGDGGAGRPDAAPLPPQTARLRIINRCAEPIWIAASGNVAEQDVPLAPGELHDYDISPDGLPSARFWPKVGCDGTGHDCDIGDVGQPPIDSKFEVTFAPIAGAAETFYNLSHVDGYTLPIAVTPIGAGAGVGNCTASDCSALTVDECPAHEDLGGGAFPAFADVDLRVAGASGTTVACMSPCKAWQYPEPYGLGRPESEDPGLHLCCPAPVEPDACRDASDPVSVVHTEYVAQVHAGCPTAYAYSYDDAAGLHQCPASTGFAVVFCP
jgi:hypothetical protein